MRLIKYILFDIIRNKILLLYTVLLFVISMGIFSFDANATKSLLSLMNIVLIVVPLVSIIFTTIYYYNAYEFTQLILAQPVKRTHLFLCQFSGVSIALVASELIGFGIPVIIYTPSVTGFLLIGVATALTLTFVSLALLGSVFTADKSKGIGISIILWFYFVFIYDALILGILFAFSDYPIEHLMMTLSFLNPVDLARIGLLMQLDNAAIMGYTGAIFNQMLGATEGIILCIVILLAWIIIPLLLSIRKFSKKDI